MIEEGEGVEIVDAVGVRIGERVWGGKADVVRGGGVEAVKRVR